MKSKAFSTTTSQQSIDRYQISDTVATETVKAKISCFWWVIFSPSPHPHPGHVSLQLSKKCLPISHICPRVTAVDLPVDLILQQHQLVMLPIVRGNTVTVQAKYVLYILIKAITSVPLIQCQHFYDFLKA